MWRAHIGFFVNYTKMAESHMIGAGNSKTRWTAGAADIRSPLLPLPPAFTV